MFSRPPTGALSLGAASLEERPLGLLGSVLRREAAMAALKMAVQLEPPKQGTREHRSLSRQLAESLTDFREASVDAIELLAKRPTSAARFYWNGMDLCLKMLTDMQWAPVPQTLDPLLWRWFSHWSCVWACTRGATDPAPFAVRGGVNMQRCRLAERALLHMAAGASTGGAGMGRWAANDLGERALALHKVQAHRLTADHSDGGVTYAQRRRFNHFERMLYGKQSVHLKHLSKLSEMTAGAIDKAAMFVQHTWRVRQAARLLARKAGVELKKMSRPDLIKREATSLAINSFLAGTAASCDLYSPIEVRPHRPLALHAHVCEVFCHVLPRSRARSPPIRKRRNTLH